MLFENSLYLCSIKHKRYNVMKAITVKKSNFELVNHFMGSVGSTFPRPTRVVPVCDSIYLWFASIFDVCEASKHLYVAGILHRVSII